ncbi:MAG TPA: YafY family protein [Dongiaceae bacterium]|jgi:predicted DNA-binding transcriptional regulator YafY|nr:YafY family protein [Dongiaceae bacterium]
MNRVDRLMAMALRLQSRRVVRAEDFAAHFEISVRTVYRDLGALSEAGIPIVAEAGIGYSLVKGYHLPPVMFTADEASALFLGEKLVEQFTDASLRKQMASALLKIRSVLPRDRQDDLDRLERATAVLPHAVANRPRLASEMLSPLQRAVAGRQVLVLEYRGGRRQEVTHRLVEPLGLVYYAENWHLIAWCRLRQDVRDFRTDRILRLELREERFAGHADFSLRDYLAAEMSSGQFELAQISFAPEVMDRVRREHYWGLVEEKPGAGFVEVTVLEHSLDFLTHWVLSFGPQARVLGPERFCQKVAAAAAQIAAQYAAPQPE